MIRLFFLFSLMNGSHVSGQTLPAPLNVRATQDLTSGVTISWDSVPGGIWYTIYRSTMFDPQDALILVDNLTGTTEFTDTAWPPETEYWYRVKARNLSAESVLSASAKGFRHAVGWNQVIWTKPGGIDIPSFTPDGLVLLPTMEGVQIIGPDGKKITTLITGTNAFRPTVGFQNSVLVASGSNVFSFSTSGTTNWVFNASYALASSVSLSVSNNVVGSQTDGVIFQLNPDGKRQWRKSVVTSKPSRVTVDTDGNCYVRSEAGEFVSLTSDGTIRWQKSVGERGILDSGKMAPPVISEMGVIWVLGRGVVHAFTQAGDLLWMYSKLFSEHEPVVDENGRVYIWSGPDTLLNPHWTAINMDGTSSGKGVDFWSVPQITFGSLQYPSSVEGRFAIAPDGTIYRTRDNLAAIRNNYPLLPIGWAGPGHDYRNTGRSKRPPRISLLRSKNGLLAKVFTSPGEEVLLWQSWDFKTWSLVEWKIAASPEVNLTLPTTAQQMYYFASSQ